MDTVPVSKARENFFGLIDQAIESHKPIAITSKRGDVVVIAREDWEAIQETLYLTSMPGMVESIILAANTPTEDCTPLEDVDLWLGE